MKDHKTSAKDPETNKPISVPKRLVIVPLREAYTFFKEKHPGVKIGLAKFAELRPAECILAGPAGTHNVCVCTIHQNVKLMIEGAGLPIITAKTTCPINSHIDCLNLILCKDTFRSPSCWLGHCSICGTTENLHKVLTEIFQKAEKQDVTYSQWVSTDRSEIVSMTEPTSDFINKLCSKILILRRHSFIAKKQTRSFTHLKENLKNGEVLVQGDFAENYKIIVQDESQSFHWNNKQVTIHPFVCYYKNAKGELQHVSYVPISECNKHDSTAVWLFQEKLIKFLKEFLKEQFDIKKIIYFSDGCAGQYKNCKNFINLCYHETDHGIKAEWHFFATSHGKGACDGVGGIIKRMVRKASLQRAYKDQITDAWQVYTYLRDHGNFQKSGLKVEYFREKDYEEADEFLKNRFAEAQTIPGTRKYHFYLPVSKTKILVKEFSDDEVGESEFSASKFGVDDTSIISPQVEVKSGDYVTAFYDDEWWLGKVDEGPDEEGMLGVKFFKPAGSEKVRTFTNPEKEDYLPVHLDDILKVVEPLRVTNRTIQLKPDDIKESCELLWKHNR